MSPQALAEAHPEVVDGPATRDQAGPHPVVSGLASALLLWSAFAPADWCWLAWGALAPLFLLIPSPRSRRSIYVGAWVGGMAFWLLSIQWVRLTDADSWLAWVVMAAVLSLWWPGFVLLARLAVRRLGVPLMVAAPVAWVGLEYVRAHILSGFPWYYLAHTQHRILPMIQIADFAGALGLSLLIAFVNAWLVDLRTVPLLRPTPRGPRLAPGQAVRLGAVVLALGTTVGYGAFRIATARFHDGPRVALLQSNLKQELKMKVDPYQILAGYQRLVEQALRQDPRLDLIVWPETSFPFRFAIRDPKLGDAEFERLARKVDPKTGADYWTEWGKFSAGQLHRWSDQMGVAMLVGVVTHEFTPAGYAKYNSAVLFEPGVASVQRYAKNYLVPFGEYVPLIEALPWLTVLTPYRGGFVPSLAFGKGPAWFTLGRLCLASAICFEDTIPHGVRQSFRRPPGGRQPDLLINISNDGWFHGSSEVDTHLAASVFRAVENRVPLARAVNTGLSALIDGNGKVLDSLPRLTEGVLSGIAPLDDRVSLYSGWGDWLGIACLALTSAILPASLFRHDRSRRPA